MAQLEVFGITTSGFSWRISGLSSPWNTEAYQSAYVDSSSWNTVSSVTAPSSGSNMYTGTGTKSSLTPNTTYVVDAFAVAANGIAYSAGSVVVKTLAVRPSNFSWSYSNISSGANAIVDARDWNALANRINAFRIYKGLSTYSISTATSGWDITAEKFNQLVNSMGSLSPYMSNDIRPSNMGSGETFYASYLRALVTSLNSVN